MLGVIVLMFRVASSVNPCCHARLCARARHVRGLSLLEVMVALMIVSIGLITAYQAQAALIQAQQRSLSQAIGQVCADNALIALRLEPNLPSSGVRELTCTQMGQDYQLELDVQLTPHEAIRRVQVRVLQADVPLYQSVGLVGRL
jgi:general secretion pathway protein I